MGSRMVKVAFVPGENEQIEAVIKLPKEPRSVIHGIVKNYNNQIVENAVVKLFQVENPHNPCSMTPISHTFTDECGQFIFGPLCPGKQYVIKVWVNDIKFKELIVCPDDFDDGCEHIKTRSNIAEEDD